jgi:hypothetical protein
MRSAYNSICAARIWFFRLRGDSVLSLVEDLVQSLAGGDCGSTLCCASVVLRLEAWPEERLRSDKHPDTLSIFGKGETGPAVVTSPDLQEGRLVSSKCLIFLT